MYSMPAGGGGDPEGLGFYREVSGSVTVTPAGEVTVNCEFPPKTLIARWGVGTSFGHGVIVHGTGIGDTALLINYQIITAVITITGNTIKFHPNYNPPSNKWGTGTTNATVKYVITGALPD